HARFCSRVREVTFWLRHPISHRPRVINRADWIVLLERGKVKMQGTPEQLRSQSGAHLDFLTP
ncbi:hypothetical protein BV378_24700, partial [Nostoc sp. RF31YmG]